MISVEQYLYSNWKILNYRRPTPEFSDPQTKFLTSIDNARRAINWAKYILPNPQNSHVFYGYSGSIDLEQKHMRVFQASIFVPHSPPWLENDVKGSDLERYKGVRIEIDQNGNQRIFVTYDSWTPIERIMGYKNDPSVRSGKPLRLREQIELGLKYSTFLSLEHERETGQMPRRQDMDNYNYMTLREVWDNLKSEISLHKKKLPIFRETIIFSAKRVSEFFRKV